MSRVEPRENPQPRREANDKLDRTPDKAEGDEQTVKEALKRQDDEDTLRLPRRS